MLISWRPQWAALRAAPHQAGGQKPQRHSCSRDPESEGQAGCQAGANSVAPRSPLLEATRADPSLSQAQSLALGTWRHIKLIGSSVLGTNIKYGVPERVGPGG